MTIPSGVRNVAERTRTMSIGVVCLALALPWPAAAQTPAGGETPLPSTFRWGPQRPDLLRYNRVEGLSVGARGQIYPRTPLGRLSITATGRLGTADRVPDVVLDVSRESLTRRITLSAYRGLAAVDEGARHLGFGNSLTALLLGRDDGDYYRRTGLSLEWTPPSAERRVFRGRAFAEYQVPVAVEADFALAHLGSDEWTFRENARADEGWDVGWSAEAAPWWGTDPRERQGGITLATRWGSGDWHYTLVEGCGTLILPLPGDLRVVAEVAGGTSSGSPPLQRRFRVGGPTTLRGYEPGAAVGTSFARARGEVGRSFAFGRVTAFSDVAWAGERAAFDTGDALPSAGVGLHLVDGLIRVDAAWGLRDPRGFRLELYLDAIH